MSNESTTTGAKQTKVTIRNKQKTVYEELEPCALFSFLPGGEHIVLLKTTTGHVRLDTGKFFAVDDHHITHAVRVYGTLEVTL